MFSNGFSQRQILHNRTVQKTRRPAQPSQPARVQPTATQSDDSGSQMRVPVKLNRPLTGLFLVFGFQTRNTRLEPIIYPYRRSITIFRSDSARSSCYPTNLGQISTDLARFLSDLDGSGHISARSRRIRPYFVPGDKLDTDPNQPETDETQTEKSDQISRSVSSQFFIHPPHSGRVRVGHKLDPWTPLLHN